tara:strand:- start:27572 stop:28927 length:1356 start_codon:yes stop_codon:yes gene_type:complete
MTVTYILILVLLLHIFLFKKLIFKWSVFGVFFIATLLFSIVGILGFPFLKSYFFESFWTFKIELISNDLIIKTQILAVSGLLLVLYSYVFAIYAFYGKVKCIDLFNIEGEIKNNLSKNNFSFLTIIVFLFLIIYLFIKRDVLIAGIFDGLLGRQPDELLESRRGITSNYLYVIITYNILPFMSIVSLYLLISKKTIYARISFIIIFTTSFFLILLLFQKRPLIIFLASLVLSGFVFKKNLFLKKGQIKKIVSKKMSRRKYIIYGGFLFMLLLLLYYSATTYQFQNIFQAVLKLSEVALSRVFGRLTIPSFFYVYYFPQVGNHYGFSNIGLFSKVFGFEHFADTKVLYQYFSRNNKEGSLAINSIMGFYGAFGYYGLVIGNLFLGILISTLDAFLNKLEKNNINLIFIVFCFVFAYYLSQASLPRSLLGYGFLFFVLLWMFLQKDFKIKLRA